MSEEVKLTALIKRVEIKTLVTGDKSGRITLETLYPDDVEKLGKMSKWMEVKVIIKKKI